MKSSVLISVKILLVFTVLLGFVYPLVLTGIDMVLFPGKAKGSLMVENGTVIGSSLIGQNFDSSIYFWSRPSAIGYNPLPSSGSNFGPTSAKLKEQMIERKQSFIAANGLDAGATVPGDMLFASASGLDPHISPASALLQINRIVKARGWNPSMENEVTGLVRRMTEQPQFGLFGNERVNVLLLNIELDKLK